METVLVVDDEESLRESLRFMLEQQHYRVLLASDGPQCLQLVAQDPPHLILLDVMLPGLDGFEVCRQLRSRGFEGAVLLLTARGEEIDQVVGLELGADDYIVKPFRHRELLARVKAHLRRNQRSEVTLRAGTLQLFPDRREAFANGEKLDLTPKEYALLQFFLENRRRAQSRERILSAVWGYDFGGETRVVNVTIQRLREKIEADPASPTQLVTVRGVGYMWNV
ncbi:response regulator transcription factor [bacterium]|nr:response regulator transcription factor [bacterium]